MTTRWDPPWYPPRRSAPPAGMNMRASDAERNAVTEKLSQHFSDGRLDQTEFKDRLDQAMNAKTRGDLQGLFDDLPPLTVDTPAPAVHHHRMRGLFLIVVIVAVLSSTQYGNYWRVPWVLIALVVILLWDRTLHHLHARRQHGALKE
jgi:hypothetical protein